MSVIDSQGRVFGRFNLVDTAVAGFLLLLLPLAYGTALLFRAPTPRIDSVTYVEPNMADLRLGQGSVLTAKLKVQGSGLNPMMRAFIGATPAIAFVLETPNSADVLVGPVPPGVHDLIIMDGIREVARAPITVAARSVTHVHATGWLTNLDPEVAESLEVGDAFPPEDPVYEIIALGPVLPGRQRLAMGDMSAILALSHLREREAVVELRCDAARNDDPCALGARAAPPVSIGLPGPVRPVGFVVQELLPAAPPQLTWIEVRFPPRSVPFDVRVGDREHSIEPRAAQVEAVRREADGAVVVRLAVGVDETREGWHHRGQIVRLGAPYEFATRDYEVTGRIVTMGPLPDGAAR